MRNIYYALLLIFFFFLVLALLERSVFLLLLGRHHMMIRCFPLNNNTVTSVIPILNLHKYFLIPIFVLYSVFCFTVMSCHHHNIIITSNHRDAGKTTATTKRVGVSIICFECVWKVKKMGCSFLASLT